MGQFDIDQMRQALIKQGMKAFVVKEMSEEELRIQCSINLSMALSGEVNFGAFDNFTKEYKHNISYTLPDGKKIKVAKVDEMVLPSGRKVEAFIDIAGNSYFQYRAADGTVLKPEYFKKQEKMEKGDSFKIKKGKVYKTSSSDRFSDLISLLENPIQIKKLPISQRSKDLAKEFHDAFENKKDTAIIEKLLNKINNSNKNVLTTYYEIYKKSLSDEILNYSGVDKKLKEKVFKIFCGYQDNLEIRDSKTDNDYWKGDSFDIKFEGNNVYITNKSTKEKAFINMDKLFKNINLLQKAKIMKTFQSFPGEVLFDISSECKNINSKEETTTFGCVDKFLNTIGVKKIEASAFYSSIKDTIFADEFGKSLIHELGHAISYKYSFKIFNRSTAKNDDNFDNAFEIGMKRYKAAGFEQFNSAKDKFSTDNSYCTASKDEMFAECYELLMTGYNQSQDAILKYFPECLEETKRILKETRKLPNNVRR